MLNSLAELLGREKPGGGAAEVASVLRCPDLAVSAAQEEKEHDDAITAGLHARVRIYRRIQQAVRNELRAGQCTLRRNQSNSSGLSASADSMAEEGSEPLVAAAATTQQQAAAPPPSPPRPGNVMMAAAIRMVLTMATQARSDTQMSASLCDALVGLLRECPPEAVAALDDADDDEEEEEGRQQPSRDRTLEAESFGRIARFARGKHRVDGAIW